MTSQNTFESQAKQYLGIQGGTTSGLPSTVFTSGILEVIGAPGRFLQLGADSANTAYLDFKSRDAGLADYDSRIVSQGGDTGTAAGEGTLSVQAQALHVLAPMKAGSSTAPAFKLDYSTVLATVGTNQVTTINFTPGLFSVAPTVVATANTPSGSTGDQSVHVEEVDAISFKVEYLGVAAAGTYINWIAVGL